MNMEIFYYIIGSVLLLAIGIGVVRFIKGPTVSDRVVALDTVSVVSTAGLVFLALLMDRYIYMDISLVYGVLGFIGVLTVARYLEKGI